MLTLKVWSAGHHIQEMQTSKEEIDETIQKIQSDLDHNQPRFKTEVSWSIPITVLCIDCFEDRKLIKEYNLSRTQ